MSFRGAIYSLWNPNKIQAAFAEAALDPSKWTDAMQVAADVTGSRGAVMIPVCGRLPSLPYSAGVAELLHSYFDDGWFRRDTRFEGLPTMIRHGVICDFDIGSKEELADTEFYQDFVRKLGFAWFAGVKVSAGDDLWCLALQRSSDQEPFSKTELRQLAGLSTSLGGAAMMARTLGFARADAALAAFEVADTAIVLLDRMGEVITANLSAERLLGPDLRIVGKRLVSCVSAATAELDRALRALLWNPAPAALMPPLVLPRSDGRKRPLLAYPMRIPAVVLDPVAPCQALLAIADLDQRPRPPADTLREAFKLTPAEVRIAQLIASGESLDDAAEILGIQRETARVQLKAVFSKTDTHRQGELVALMASLLGARIAST